MSADAPTPVPADGPEIAAYERLAELAEQALVAAGTGDDELLERLMTAWTDEAAALPGTPPAAAADALERAAAAHNASDVLLRAARERLGDELARAATGRRTATGYGAGAATGAFGVRTEHRA